MNWLNKLERKFGRYAVHNLTTYLIGTYIIGYAIRLFIPDMMIWLYLQPGAILHGQIWRIVSWILVPPQGSLLEIVKLIGSDVLPDDQKLILEIARVIRLGFLQQNAFHKDDTCVSMEKQFKMMDTILYLYKQARALVTMGHPMSVLKSENIFDRVIAIKYDVPNDRLELFAQYHRDIDAFYQHVLEKNTSGILPIFTSFTLKH